MKAPATSWVPGLHEIIYIDHTPSAGDEIHSEHPLLVLSTAIFNSKTGFVVGLPMTHSDRHKDNPFALKITGSKKDVAYILCHQPKSFDWRDRGARPHPLGKAPASVVTAAKEVLGQIIGLE